MSRHRTGPPLPRARGELSTGVIAFLREEGSLPDPGAARDADPYGDDLQLALYVCYELHYRGFAGVRPEREWDPPLLAVRGALEERFLTALRHDVPTTGDLDDVLEDLLVEPVRGSGVSWFLQDRGELRHLRDYAVQRSLYHLKEADPHAWVLPRLSGRAKAGMAAIEYDEFGAGRADRVHARLFAGLMTDLGLDTAYGHYLDQGCAPMLALVNVMSLFGLHRRLRGALVGHFAAVEITSSPGSRRLANAMKRTGAGPAAEFFYTEHVEADAVHEQVVRRDVIGGLLEDEPAMATDIAFGITATSYLEDRLGDRLLADWKV
ncbi:MULTISPECIES: iron-containing redox enzyme family protein [Streptomyces]|uniref:Iron-containing redox enzyme family protein n=1 Tax=Streptomyces glycanivorans TaxID=3033808 RepID=A0ABY9J5Y6_9ACTN|nr:MULTISPECIES: iron-containing redox enzyme family protein [unclassified Streptomyces]WSQ75782.1 iron-containing redox enzyme family protein [Streptomyces sp. NBC_01213]TXS15656.1 iron-containing redox enzyme family protein [Streptomyces sp. wa22]WLQ62274.1 iron-containing redox enzyme family protein [Streptomyces sp. Alt3]WSQ83030.1 iron-containing redox enzyme family protein [Streptomyces sp. NBC_01212]WSR10942.1 iron-containing redox enzyme family protein [Streptomyces sp. NBC_01208]